MSRKYIQKFLSIFGFRLERIIPQVHIEPSWFSFDVSCQIPFLSEIYENVFGRGFQGQLIEVGAFDGSTYSNSSGLIERGWQAVLVEAVPEYAEKCRAKYSGNSRVKVVECAVTNFTGLVEIEKGGALSSIDKNTIAEYNNLDWSRPHLSGELIQVQARKLEEIAIEFCGGIAVDLLIVDVEGAEEAVFQEFNLKRWAPVMIIVELADFHPFLNSSKQSHARLSKFISESGYSIIYKDAINTIFLNSAKTLQLSQ